MRLFSLFFLFALTADLQVAEYTLVNVPMGPAAAYVTNPLNKKQLQVVSHAYN